MNKHVPDEIEVLWWGRGFGDSRWHRRRGPWHMFALLSLWWSEWPFGGNAGIDLLPLRFWSHLGLRIEVDSRTASRWFVGLGLLSVFWDHHKRGWGGTSWTVRLLEGDGLVDVEWDYHSVTLLPWCFWRVGRRSGLPGWRRLHLGLAEIEWREPGP